MSDSADTATGLLYSGARRYDPASGRFMTEDTDMGTQVVLADNFTMDIVS